MTTPKMNLAMVVGDWLMESHHLMVDQFLRLWRWDQMTNRWALDEDLLWFKRSIQDYMRARGISQYWSLQLQLKIHDYIICRLEEPLVAPPVDRVQVLNGTVALEPTGPVLHAHDPGLRYINQLPVFFNPEARPIHWERMLRQMFPASFIPVVWEIAAWMIFSVKEVNSIVCLLGEAGSGKSRIIRAFYALLGADNIIALSQQQLESNRFALSHINYKLGVVYDDLPAKMARDNGVLKMISDGAKMMGELKFKGSKWVVNYANCLFAANWPPRSVDTSDGFYDRWFILPCNKRWRFTEGQEANTELDARFSDPDELSGVLNKAIEALPRLKRQLHFTRPPEIQTAIAEFRESTHPIWQWFFESMVFEPEASVMKNDVLINYNRWARRQRINQVSLTALGRELGRLFEQNGLELETVRVREGHERNYYWKGLTWKSLIL